MSRLPWSDRFWRTWNSILASERFQRWASAFPLTRPLALRRSRGLFDLVAGFVYSQTLVAAIRLDLFERMAAGAVDLDQLAADVGVPLERLARLLDAGVSLQLFRRHGAARFGLGPLGAPMVGNDALAAMIEHNQVLYEDLARPLSVLRQDGTTQLGRYWAYATAQDPTALEEDAVADYTALMTASQSLVRQEVMDAYDFGRHTSVLDVGGGQGAFLAGLAGRWPDLDLHLFDLPAVIARARPWLATQGIASRVHLHAGSFLTDPLPEGSDVVSLVRVAHDLDDGHLAHVLRAAYTALPPGGRIVIGEPMARQRGAEPVGAAYFAWYLMAMGQGRARSPRELSSFLRTAGFRGIRRPRARAPVLGSVVFATR